MFLAPLGQSGGPIMTRLKEVLIAAMLCVIPVGAIAGNLLILTGGTSGVYYPVGVKIKEILEREMPSTSFTVMSTQATVENLNMLQKGEGVLALAQGDILSEAWKGNPEAGFPSSRTKIRLVGAAYPNYIHLLSRTELGIASLRDLVGKRVSVGPSRSGNELNARALLGAAGLSYADLLHVEYLHYAESVELFVRGDLDAVIISAGLGVSAVTDAVARTSVSFVPIERDIVEVNPQMFYATDIPAGSYQSQEVGVQTAALGNFFVTSSHAPDELIYRITKAIYDNLDEIRGTHPAAIVMNRENALAARPIDVHPGSLRYFDGRD